jgi:hypothetical protein
MDGYPGMYVHIYIYMEVSQNGDPQVTIGFDIRSWSDLDDFVPPF